MAQRYRREDHRFNRPQTDRYDYEPPLQQRYRREDHRYNRPQTDRYDYEPPLQQRYRREDHRYNRPQTDRYDYEPPLHQRYRREDHRYNLPQTDRYDYEPPQQRYRREDHRYNQPQTDRYDYEPPLQQRYRREDQRYNQPQTDRYDYEPPLQQRYRREDQRYNQPQTDRYDYEPPLQQRYRREDQRYNQPQTDRYDYEPPLTCIDTHCHLDILFKKIGFGGSFAEYFKSAGLPTSFEGCIAVFSHPRTFKTFGESRCNPNQCGKRMWTAFGCHPHHADYFDDEAERNLKIALTNPNVVALGEIGLDFSNRNGVHADIQIQVFQRQIHLAVERELPIVIHSRDASNKTLEIMEKHVPRNHPVHRHCFTGNCEEAEKWLDTFPNLYIGFTNVISYPSAKDVREVVRKIPIERMLLETDAPYFGDDKGIPSNPGMVVDVAIQIARLKNVETTEVIRRTRENTRRIYRI